MSVVIKPANERVSRSALAEAFGLVSEHIAANDDVRKAVLLVLGYEQDRIPTTAIRGVPSDIAHAETCWRDGKREGLELAALALLDAKHIADVREGLDEANKENES